MRKNLTSALTLNALFAFGCGGETLQSQFPGDEEIPFDTGSEDTGGIGIVEIVTDADGDGHDAPEFGGDDCNDANPDVHPGADEICDGNDQDCDRQIDEGVSTTWYYDADGDTFGDSSQSLSVCTGLEPADDHWTLRDGDCEPSLMLSHPGAPDLCSDGIDNDCDGLVDEVACVGTIVCTAAEDGVNVVISGDITSGQIQPALTLDASDPDSTVGAVIWGDWTNRETPYVGDFVDHTLTLPVEDFTPFVSDGRQYQWLDLSVWNAMGDCSVTEHNNFLAVGLN